jgi:hypothetical protein
VDLATFAPVTSFNYFALHRSAANRFRRFYPIRIREASHPLHPAYPTAFYYRSRMCISALQALLLDFQEFTRFPVSWGPHRPMPNPQETAQLWEEALYQAGPNLVHDFFDTGYWLDRYYMVLRALFTSQFCEHSLQTLLLTGDHYITLEDPQVTHPDYPPGELSRLTVETVRRQALADGTHTGPNWHGVLLMVVREEIRAARNRAINRPPSADPWIVVRTDGLPAPPYASIRQRDHNRTLAREGRYCPATDDDQAFISVCNCFTQEASPSTCPLLGR